MKNPRKTTYRPEHFLKGLLGELMEIRLEYESRQRERSQSIEEFARTQDEFIKSDKAYKESKEAVVFLRIVLFGSILMLVLSLVKFFLLT